MNEGEEDRNGQSPLVSESAEVSRQSSMTERDGGVEVSPSAAVVSSGP